VGDCVPHWPV